jgi:CRP/FNR family transcriptional regulator
MPTPLHQHIAKILNIDPGFSEDISNRFRRLTVKKKTVLLSEGDLCRYIYFVEKGCLRLYFTKDNGTQQTTQFALENWWLSDYTAFNAQTTAQFAIETVELSDILYIDSEGLEKLFADHPAFEKYFRLVHQRAAAAAQNRIRFLYELTREEMYTNFITKYPAFCQRIPQYLLASFLGITPEYLSEIRKKAAMGNVTPRG